MKEDYVFVYGTLRRGVGHPMSEVMERFAQEVGAARVAGRIYELGGFPGLVAGEEGDWVVGEVFRVLNAGELWPRLDAYEGVAQGLYAREKMPVRGLAGVKEAWVYLYLKSTDEASWVRGGDYLASE